MCFIIISALQIATCNKRYPIVYNTSLISFSLAMYFIISYSALPLFVRFNTFIEKSQLICCFHDVIKGSVVIGNTERHMRKSSHCGSKQQ